MSAFASSSSSARHGPVFAPMPQPLSPEPLHSAASFNRFSNPVLRSASNPQPSSSSSSQSQASGTPLQAQTPSTALRRRIPLALTRQPPRIQTNFSHTQPVGPAPLERVPTEPASPSPPPSPTLTEKLEAQGIKVKDYAYEKPLLPPVPVVRKPVDRSLKRVRDERNEARENRRPFFGSPRINLRNVMNIVGSNHQTIATFGIPSHPYPQESSRSNSNAGPSVIIFPGGSRDPPVLNTQTLDTGRTTSPLQNGSSSQPDSQDISAESQPPLLSTSQSQEDSQMQDEEYVKTPLVTPNGSFIFETDDNADTENAEMAEVDESVLDTADLSVSQIAAVAFDSQAPAGDFSVSQMGFGSSQGGVGSQDPWQQISQSQTPFLFSPQHSQASHDDDDFVMVDSEEDRPLSVPADDSTATGNNCLSVLARAPPVAPYSPSIPYSLSPVSAPAAAVSATTVTSSFLSQQQQILQRHSPSCCSASALQSFPSNSLARHESTTSVTAQCSYRPRSSVVKPIRISAPAIRRRTSSLSTLTPLSRHPSVSFSSGGAGGLSRKPSSTGSLGASKSPVTGKARYNLRRQGGPASSAGVKAKLLGIERDAPAKSAAARHTRAKKVASASGAEGLRRSARKAGN